MSPSFVARCVLVIGAVVFPLQVAHAQAPLPPASELKKMSLDELLSLQVTSVSRRPERLAEVPSAVQVITGDDIRRAGATSIAEALRLATNLEVAQIDARQWAISARGFNDVFADKMLVMIDGRSVYTPLYAGVYWDVQDTMLDDLDRIEVISGPGATQWGANAVNGVINITTKNARDTQGGRIVSGAGTELRDFSALRYGGKLAPNIYYRVYAKNLERDDSLMPNGAPAQDNWRASQVGFRVDADAIGTDTLTLQGDAYDSEQGQKGPDDSTASGANLLGRWTRAFAGGSSVALQAYYDGTHRSIPGSFVQDINTYDLDFQHRLLWAEGCDLAWGLGYRLVADDIVNTPREAFLPPNVRRESYSGFVQSSFALADDRLHLTLGTKVEHNAYTGVEIEPSIRCAWVLDAQQTVWAAISRAVRTPSRIDRDLYSPAEPPYRIAGGGNQVVSEIVRAYELGYRMQLESRLAISLATFVNSYADLRSLEPMFPPRPFPVQASSGLSGRSAGAELTVDWLATPAWRLRGGWTELRVMSWPAASENDRATRDSIARDPNHQLFLRSLLNLSSHWELDADVRYVAKIPKARVPGYVEANVRLGWRPNESWEFSVLGKNLLHARHAEFNAPGARRELQRGVYASATWAF